MTGDDVAAGLLRGECTINEAWQAAGLAPITDGNVRVSPPLPDNLRKAFNELRRRRENGTDCWN